MESTEKKSALAAFIKSFIEGKAALILVIVALCFGLSAVILTPREEEPQIVVPLADVIVHFPGVNADEVESLVTTPLEKLLWQIDGVEYVYSLSKHDMAVVTVRFFVGEDRERSLVKLYNKINSNTDLVPPGVSGWVVKPIEIDDVPIVTLSLHSTHYSDHEMRRIGEELLARLDSVEDISKSYIVGGRPREVRVELNQGRLQGTSISPLEVMGALKGADFSLTTGTVTDRNRTYNLRSNSFLESLKEIESLVVGASGGKPVYLRDVAIVTDMPSEAESYTRYGYGPQSDKSGTEPSVTLALAKKKGTNAVKVANEILESVEKLRETIVPDEVQIKVTRNYGQTANQKVNDLLISLAFAIITVVSLLAYTIGWREGLVVALAVPITFSLSLFVNLLAGYTINRVTLFALILSLGLVVDDPITNVDNIQRHMTTGKGRSPINNAINGIMEVMPPVLMSTLTIIVSFAPMFFITGMMGPYMAPMAVNVPLAVSFSTLVSLTITPWAAYSLLKSKKKNNSPDHKNGESSTGEDSTKRFYRMILEPLLNSKSKSFAVLIFVLILLLLSGSLVLLRKVPLKMLPFDNKNEFQIILDMKEGATLESMDGVVRKFEHYLSTVNEVKDFQSYVGTSAPIDFNGLVRHYYMRKAPHLADIRVNLFDKTKRKQQSHAMALRIRKDLQEIARASDVDLKIVEAPPGPPVIATVVAEVTGTPDLEYNRLIKAAKMVGEVLSREKGVVDIDTSAEEPHKYVGFVIDKEKASMHGISATDLIMTLRLAVNGESPALRHLRHERQPLPVKVRLPLLERSDISKLSGLAIKGASGKMIQLAELGDFVEYIEDQPIHHKNLKRVVYLFAEAAGRSPGEVILDVQKRVKDMELPEGISVNWSGEGEWKITIEVFRDLGIAFGAAMLMIYILLILQTGSFLMPLVIMQAIPLTVIGILPGFYLLNLVTAGKIGGFENPVFFTATAMIGMIALGGIVVRNSLVLIEFITGELNKGAILKEAILSSGASRLRPILLTAATTLLGALPITIDPVFSGLAWALIFGLISSTIFTLIIVPVIYNLLYPEGEVGG